MAKTQEYPFGPSKMPAEYEITLHCNAGTSDKIYKLQIAAAGNGMYVVNVANARRGEPLVYRRHKSPSEPSAYGIARAAAASVLAEKVKKDYRPILAEGAGSAAPFIQEGDTGYRPQLLMPIDSDAVPKYISDARYVAQEKKNGQRRLIFRDQDGVITGARRSGMVVGLPPSIVNRFQSEDERTTFCIDGEIIGDTYFAFDMLAFDGIDLRPEPYEHRLKFLKSFFAEDVVPGGGLLLSESCYSTEDKKGLLAKVKAAQGEGVVFKLLSSPYVAGEWDTQLKFKFWHSLSAVVTKHNVKRSVRMGLYDGEAMIDIGGVTIPPNQGLPDIGAIIEVKYLYAMESGGLHQPSFEEIRMDIPASDCTADQRVFSGVKPLDGLSQAA